MSLLTPARCAIAAAAALAGLALTPATGGAALVPFGSDLVADANLSEARPVDTVYWQTAFPDGRSVVSPASGQLRSVRIKGVALSDRVAGGPSGGERDFHVQVLRPLPDGTFQIRELGTSGNFELPPRTANPQGVTEYAPENLCVQQGDVVAFNTVGGFEPLAFPIGTPLQIFSRIPAAVVSEFTGAGQTNNGAIVRGTPVAGRELLMQATVGTGPDGTGLCPGGGSTPPPAGTPPPPPPPLPAAGRVQKATIPTQRLTVSKAGRFRVGLFCRSGPARCAGTLRVMTRGAKPKSVGSTAFGIASGRTGHPAVTLNRRGRALLKAGRGRLAVKLVAETRPGGASRRSTLLTTLRRR